MTSTPWLGAPPFQPLTASSVCTADASDTLTACPMGASPGGPSRGHLQNWSDRGGWNEGAVDRGGPEGLGGGPGPGAPTYHTPHGLPHGAHVAGNKG